MSRKQYFMIVDTETTQNATVADFAAIVVDRKGSIVAQCAVLVAGQFRDVPLFSDNRKGSMWTSAYAAKKQSDYERMLESGSRMIASVNAINRWLEKAAAKYNPTLTAYNLSFDVEKCRNTGIDLTMFPNRFCLWQAAVGMICDTKAYKNFVLQNHLFNAPTEHGNMSYKTNAECVTGFLTGSLTDEPHTALEDAVDYELPILNHILAKRDWKDKIVPYNWSAFQVKDHFKV